MGIYSEGFKIKNIVTFHEYGYLPKEDFFKELQSDFTIKHCEITEHMEVMVKALNNAHKKDGNTLILFDEPDSHILYGMSSLFLMKHDI